MRRKPAELADALAAYMDKQRPQKNNRYARHVVSLSKRISGKAGRIRCNISGKRTDWSSRTVITCDAFLDVTQVGVPELIARAQSVPETVTERNLDAMRAAVRGGDASATAIVLPSRGQIVLRGLAPEVRARHAARLCVGQTAVSYTHLTLPTIYSV